ncbi:hypothetical protein BJ508DRAFT_333969 [Ascobolus immersus RN42]|uniref:Uncharacterized protein n=1 Tax=Ascobolus immersus RN42 TaxID=1160509 RepID=A0A3N4HVA2_ASCIM|nr:hypothetical protein BJ508DRAFT_333969 [Ascobolus immersus RN42]
MDDFTPLKLHLRNMLHSIPLDPTCPSVLDTLTTPPAPAAPPGSPPLLFPLPPPPMTLPALLSLLEIYTGLLRLSGTLHPYVQPPALPPAPSTLSPLTKALTEMRPSERSAFTTWFTPSGFPILRHAFDWTTSKRSSIESGNQKKRNETERRVEALRIMFDDESLGKEEYFYLRDDEEVGGRVVFLPVLLGFARVFGAWRQGYRGLEEVVEGGCQWERMGADEREWEVCRAIGRGVDLVVAQGGWGAGDLGEVLRVKGVISARMTEVGKRLEGKGVGTGVNVVPVGGFAVMKGVQQWPSLKHLPEKVRAFVEKEAEDGGRRPGVVRDVGGEALNRKRMSESVEIDTGAKDYVAGGHIAKRAKVATRGRGRSTR